MKDFDTACKINPDLALYSKDLQCNFMQWRVIGDYALALDLPVMNHCDMSGAIKVATSLLPTVDYIEIWEHGVHLAPRLTTRYVINEDTGEWGCL